ncbi:general stress protein [Rhizobium sp. LjRoot98]|uniref:general stress protein n=1 Tax=unclassified Rhizobium TaxID=2613769 RepID=UPI00071568A0|nr:general stress protein [Rhizobium sp. Root1204]KQV35274.1 stress-induced protein [Rhizobium sp. Root1204]
MANQGGNQGGNQSGQQGGNQGGDTSKRGFASMDDDKQKDIASEGGKASGGNFKNDPERASEAGKKGGENSSGGNR